MTKKASSRPSHRARKQVRAPKPVSSSPPARDRAVEAIASNAAPSEPSGFCIVGIGASAGGLEALEEFLDGMPPDSGMAFVIIQHLDPGYKSIMVDLLMRHTAMPVHQVINGETVAPNTVYVIPPHKYLGILHGVLHLIDPDPNQAFRLPIDYFMRSLADDQAERAICIIVSGTGTDGALGLKAVKAAGGLTLAQDETSAKYDSMPRSAVATGNVDFVLPVRQMPKELLKYARHPYVAKLPIAETTKTLDQGDQLEKVFVVLRAHTGHDFSLYKRNTIVRRIERRMAVHQIQRVADYVRYLQQNRAEIDALFQELLIGVTSFFRDPESFEVIKSRVIPQIFEHHSPELPVRIWVAGCSTGEEAYSLAMLFTEYGELTSSQHLKVQIFATDIDHRSLDVARVGLYPESIAADVSPERLKAFFVKEGPAFRIKKSIREMVILAKQDLIKDPPFSRLDLIMCRNLLIYLTPTLQRRVLPLFHYTLSPNGFLVLGPSETIGEFADLFALVDKKWKIFRRKTAARSVVDLPSLGVGRDSSERRAASKPASDATTTQITERVLLDTYAPPCVIVNEQYDVVHFRGRTGQYLEPPSGEPSLNVLKMAREGLRIELRSAIHQAFKRRVIVTRKGVRVKHNGGWTTVDLVVRPFDHDALQGLAMVAFEEAPHAAEVHPTDGGPPESDQRAVELEHELNSTRESLQTTIEELETSNEELKSTNEELQSTNEELQSTNEELETSKEEMQSVNEELVTVNSELQIKLDELGQANNDMSNLLSSAEVGTIFLDNNLKIKRFTPSIAKVINLIPGDIGRPISHIAPNLIYDRLTADVEEVLRTLVFKERELQTKEGGWYLMRIHPYRTLENVIQGAVVTFVDISSLKSERLCTQAALFFMDELMASMSEPLLILSPKLKVVAANEAYCFAFAIRTDELVGSTLYRINEGRWNTPAVKGAVTELGPLDQGNREVSVGKAGDSGVAIMIKKLKLPGPLNGHQELFMVLIRTAKAS